MVLFYTDKSVQHIFVRKVFRDTKKSSAFASKCPRSFMHLPRQRLKLVVPPTRQRNKRRKTLKQFVKYSVINKQTSKEIAGDTMRTLNVQYNFCIMCEGAHDIRSADVSNVGLKTR